MFTLRSLLMNIVVVLLGIGLVPALASADGQKVAKKGTVRDGFIIGIGLGVGHMEATCEVGCRGVSEAGGLHLQLGIMATSRLAIMGDVWAMGHREDRITLSQGIVSVGPQFWLTDRLWLRAGAGLSRSSFNYDAVVVEFEDLSEYVPAATAAVGFEFVHTNDFALDVELRGGAGFFQKESNTQILNTSIGVGASWY